MARIRTFKPSFWGDDKVSELSFEARYLFLGLISCADDAGRFLASHQAVAGYVFPNDEGVTPVKLRRWIEELEALGLVLLYSVGKIRYGAIPNWRKHQKISHPQKSTLPPPPDDGLFPE